MDAVSPWPQQGASILIDCHAKNAFTQPVGPH